jgi:hypothetical protein
MRKMRRDKTETSRKLDDGQLERRSSKRCNRSRTRHQGEHMTSTKQAYEWVKADHWSFLQFNEWLDAVRLSQRTEQEPEWKPTEADYKEWWDRHGLHGPTSREAFYDAASLYLNASSPAAQPSDPAGQAPCVRHCEATAFQIVIKNLRGDIERMKAAQPPQRTEPLIGCVNHDCAKCKEKNT